MAALVAAWQQRSSGGQHECGVSSALAVAAVLQQSIDSSAAAVEEVRQQLVDGGSGVSTPALASLATAAAA
jgi:hypothetical protein